MSDIEFVKMSEKGQLVVPQNIRDSSNLNPGERFVAFPLSDGVLFKKVEMSKIKLDFDKLAKDVQAQFKKNNVKPRDVVEAIKWARKK
jgi:bifunctional DNA-binding transcriptional regulator/antitoxin component of YhaV-PrlF toxin-antitoxin module